MISSDLMDLLDKSSSETICNINSLLDNFKTNYNLLNNERRQYVIDRNQLNDRYSEFMKSEREIRQLEQDCNVRMEKLEIREKAVEKELEEGRKVSILKNIQTQLNQKTAECELTSRQLSIYKSRCDVLNSICSKYFLNFEQITMESIESAILASVRVPEVKTVVEEEVDELDGEEEVIKDETNIVVDTPEASCDEAEEEPQEEEGIEVIDFSYKGHMYYIDNASGDIYARLEDDEVGDIIGYKDEKGRVKFGLRKK